MWRFLELHLHKIICLVLFATTISQISVLYLALLAFLLALVVPVPFINALTYPLLSLYLGTVTILKMVYQFPVISPDRFSFSPDTPRCMPINVSGKGVVMEGVWL
jgi:hypothetical protein